MTDTHVKYRREYPEIHPATSPALLGPLVDSSVRDGDEHPSVMEPMLPAASGTNRRRLEDLGVDLVAKATGWRDSSTRRIRDEVGALVRSMDCYYSNLIEGHNTHPVDIERALRDDYSHEPAKRALQLEARAHVEVQAMLDGATPEPSPGLTETPTTAVFVTAVHREFC
jgi:hypothetical protein